MTQTNALLISINANATLAQPLDKHRSRRPSGERPFGAHGSVCSIRRLGIRPKLKLKLELKLKREPKLKLRPELSRASLCARLILGACTCAKLTVKVGQTCCCRLRCAVAVAVAGNGIGAPMRNAERTYCGGEQPHERRAPLRRCRNQMAPN